MTTTSTFSSPATRAGISSSIPVQPLSVLDGTPQKPIENPGKRCGAERDRTVGLLNAILELWGFFSKNSKPFPVQEAQKTPSSPSGTGNDFAAPRTIQAPLIEPRSAGAQFSRPGVRP
ncbi:MAG TPA: hypothetical protein VJ140_10180 [Actinomycetota bacterium]|nr:hypothetical protein [Actinomycetota bacterium]